MSSASPSSSTRLPARGPVPCSPPRLQALFDDSPSFLTHRVHALVGPLFFVALLTGAYSVKSQPLNASASRA